MALRKPSIAQKHLTATMATCVEWIKLIFIVPYMVSIERMLNGGIESSLAL